MPLGVSEPSTATKFAPDGPPEWPGHPFPSAREQMRLRIGKRTSIIRRPTHDRLSRMNADCSASSFTWIGNASSCDRGAAVRSYFWGDICAVRGDRPEASGPAYGIIWSARDCRAEVLPVSGYQIHAAR